MKQHDEEMNLAALSEHTGTPGRTIRLYISMGLLPGPLRPGRNAAYGREHLERLETIHEMRREGLTLGQIRETLTETGRQTVRIPASRWRHFMVAPDVQIVIDENVPPWRMHALMRAVDQFARLANVEPLEETQEE